MFYSVVLAAIGVLEELRITSISFCHVCPLDTSRILEVLSWNVILSTFRKFVKKIQIPLN
jgi:hypothetical protein